MITVPIKVCLSNNNSSIVANLESAAFWTDTALSCGLVVLSVIHGLSENAPQPTETKFFGLTSVETNGTVILLLAAAVNVLMASIYVRRPLFACGARPRQPNV